MAKLMEIDLRDFDYILVSTVEEHTGIVFSTEPGTILGTLWGFPVVRTVKRVLVVESDDIATVLTYLRKFESEGRLRLKDGTDNYTVLEIVKCISSDSDTVSG